MPLGYSDSLLRLDVTDGATPEELAERIEEFMNSMIV